MFLYIVCAKGLIFLGIILLSLLWVRRKRQARTIGLFHPYCNAGGGGERVLWLAVQSLLQTHPDYTVYVYTGDAVSANEILEKADKSFGVKFTTRKPSFVFLKNRWLVEATTWPVLTMAGQSFGSMLLAVEALSKLVPEVYVDSMGYAFTLPLFYWWGGCRIGCYVHYPTISTDMLSAVKAGGQSYNNSKLVARHKTLRNLKLRYYKLFAYFYSVAGRYSESIMVNSSWTKGHILELWKVGKRTHLVYPPCNVTRFLSIGISEERKPIILSIAQFRPEKNHTLQIQALAELLKQYPQWKDIGLKLVMIGGVRNKGDADRVDQLKQTTRELDVEQYVDIKANLPYPELVEYTAMSLVGIHSMWNEHFGIGIVELLASGIITIAHNSGGPKMDIIKHPYNYNNDPSNTTNSEDATGFLAVSASEYAEAMNCILTMSSSQRKIIQTNARNSTNRFSDEQFQEQWRMCTKNLMHN